MLVFSVGRQVNFARAAAGVCTGVCSITIFFNDNILQNGKALQ